MIELARNKISLLRADRHAREVARGAALAFVFKVAGSGLAFALNVAIARLLGAEGAGLYFLALSVTSVGLVIGSVGLRNALLRLVSAHAAHQEWDLVQGVHALGMRLAVVVAGGLSLLGFILAPWMAGAFFHKATLGEPLRWMCLSILPFTLLNLQAQSLMGLKRIGDAMLLQSIGVPLVCLVLIWPLVQLASLEGATWAYLLATVSISLLGSWYWRQAVSGYEVKSAHFPPRQLWSSCIPLFFVSLTGEGILPYAPTLLLGIWASASEVGVFGAANRVALIMSFMMTAANIAIAPKFAELYARRELTSLRRLARHSLIANTLLATPVFAVLFFFGGNVLALFGEEFRQGANMLAILSVGELINSITGPVGYLLVMSGQETVYRNLTAAFALLLILLLSALIPAFGGIGAASATAISVAGLNLASFYFARKLV